MIDSSTLLAVLAMACVTFSTRIAGYLILRDRTLGPCATAVMTAAPGCVLISVIAPNFVSTSPAHLAALGLTVLAASRLSMLPTILVGVVSAALLRQFIL